MSNDLVPWIASGITLAFNAGIVWMTTQNNRKQITELWLQLNQDKRDLAQFQTAVAQTYVNSATLSEMRTWFHSEMQGLRSDIRELRDEMRTRRSGGDD